jgi:hypothetical protein
MIRNRSPAIMRSKWFLPLFCLAIGVVIFVASWLGGQPGAGVFALAFMAAVGLVLLLAARNETIRGLTWGRDERFALIDLRATATAGLAVLVTLIVAWLVEIAHGRSGHPYDWLVVVSSIAYIVSVAFFRWRG